MTSSHLTELMKNVDPVDALRLLMADLQALADRLALKEQSRSLRQTLKATQERIFGPRTVVMLLGEQAALKRRFLERLLGPELAAVPEPAGGCLRLEHGAEADCTVTMPQGLTAVLPLSQMPDFLARRGVEMPQQVMQTIRLPNLTLSRGLAVIDTPALGVAAPSDSAQTSILESASQADAWVFVLGADHALSEGAQALLRRLPERMIRLDMVVEGAEGLSGEARLAARRQLIDTLRHACGIPEPRLTLLASPDAEGEEGSFWHGRFATFQSVMMLRGRERWLETARGQLRDALNDTTSEIEFELKGVGLGLRQTRLRLGLRTMDGLRARFEELGRMDNERPREVSTAAVAALAEAHAALPVEIEQAAVLNAARSPVGATSGETEAEAASPAGTPLMQPTAALNDAAVPDVPSSGQTLTTPLGPQPDHAAASIGEPTFVSFRGQEAASAAPRRGVSVRLSGKLADLLQADPAERKARTSTLLRRVGGAALFAAIVCFLLWAVWPRMHTRAHEPAAQWDYQPPTPGASNVPKPPAGPDAFAGPDAALPPPESASSGPDVTTAETPTAAAADGKSTATTSRRPLPRPSASVPSESSTVRARRRRRHLLGLDRLWHWMRRDHGQPRGSDQQ